MDQRNLTPYNANNFFAFDTENSIQLTTINEEDLADNVHTLEEVLLLNSEAEISEVKTIFKMEVSSPVISSPIISSPVTTERGVSNFRFIQIR